MRIVVMMSSAASHGIGPVLYKDVPYDPLGDFTHIHLVGDVPQRARRQWRLERHDRQAARRAGAHKARRDHLRSGGNGTMNHLVGQLLARSAGSAAHAHSLSRLGAGDERSAWAARSWR
jgi:hypothetical protein